MPNELQTKTNTEQIEHQKTEVLEPGIKRILWGGSGLLALLLVFTFALPTGRILFFTGSFLGLVTLVVIAMQSLTYSNQWKAMSESLAIERAKTNPRLRVSNIRIENFKIGGLPMFIVTIANDGLIDATGVELHIGINLGDGRAFQWIEPQTVIIPARGEESYPVRTGASLSEQDMRGFSFDVPIEVRVRLKYWPGSPDEPTEFCYRYLPWPNERPKDVRQFYPCDFKPRLNISLRVSGVLAIGNITTRGEVIPAKTETQNEESTE